MTEGSTIDDVREYWNRRPCNLRHSDLPLGTRKYFDAVEARKYFVEPHIPGFADFSCWDNKSVLEVGCGIGTDAVNFARSGAQYVGVELSGASLEMAKKRFDVFSLEGQFVEADVERLTESSVPEGPYDLIYSFGVLHHTVNPAKAVSELAAFAGPGTELRVMLYAKHSWKAMLIEEGLDQPEAQDHCPIALTYSQEEARDLIESAGFSVEKIWQDHVFPYQVKSYVDYEYKREPWFDAMPDSLFRAVESGLGWHMLIVANLRDQLN